MKKHTRIIPFILILSLLFTLLSCMKSQEINNEAPTGESLSDAGTTEIPFDTGLPSGLNFNKKELNIAITGDKRDLYVAEEVTGSTFNDALYNRNKYVEELLNIKINTIGLNPDLGGDVVAAVKKFQTELLAGNPANYHLFTPHLIAGGAPLITSGAIQPWNEVPHIDFEKPWWNANINKTMAINGQSYYAVNDYLIVAKSVTFIMLFNKALVGEYGLENPYDLVNTGKWTVDKFAEQVKATTQDINGDGNMTEDDRYGLGYGTYGGQVLNFMYATGEYSVLPNSEGVYEYNMGNTRIQTMLDKLVTLFKEVKTLDYKEARTTEVTKFSSGNMYMFAAVVEHLPLLTNSEVDYGILPYPKLDEAQSGYYTHTDAWGGAFCIASNWGKEDLEMVGAAVTALGAESYKSIVPIYVDNLLSVRYARDEESIKMLDLVFKGIIYDFGYIYDPWTVNCVWTFPSLLMAKSNSLASEVEKNKQKVETYFQKLYDTVSETQQKQ